MRFVNGSYLGLKKKESGQIYKTLKQTDTTATI
jgi:hypothetical protein